jgi:DNA-binding Lrp family transcriptional regulator
MGLKFLSAALLDALQRSGNATNSALGEAVHLSASQVSRRLQRLQDAGLIAGFAALLNPGALGLGVTAFAHVMLERQGGARVEAFEEGVAALPEVLECFSVSGNADYVLRIVAPDLAAFSELIETCASPARHSQHQDRHRAEYGQADSCAAPRPHQPATHGPGNG